MDNSRMSGRAASLNAAGEIEVRARNHEREQVLVGKHPCVSCDALVTIPLSVERAL